MSVSFTNRWRKQTAPTLEVEVFGQTYTVKAEIPAIVPLILADLQRLDAESVDTLPLEQQMDRGTQVLTAFRRVVDATFGRGVFDQWLDAGASIDELRDVVFWIAAGYQFIDLDAEPDAPLADAEAEGSPSPTSSPTGR